MKSGSCAICGSVGRLERHHDPPRSRGGGKIVVLCRECHKALHRQSNHFHSPRGYYKVETIHEGRKVVLYLPKGAGFIRGV